MAIDPVIRLLGPVSIGRRDDVRSAGGPRQAAVLAVLALQTGRPVSVERLIDAVWGDEFPDSVANVIQVYISALRKLLRPTGLTISRSGPTYTLDATLTDVDAELFQRLAAEGRAALRSRDPSGALALFDEARHLWRSEPFAGLDGCPFAAGATSALRAVALTVATDRGAALCALDQPSDAVVAAEELIATSPYHEPAWGLLMRALYYSGRQREAVNAFARARDRFIEDLGLDLSADLVDLERRILDRTLESLDEPPPVPTIDVPNVAPPSSGRQVPLPPTLVVGRQVEVGRIVALLEESTRLVTLVGLGGIGKTTAALVVMQQLATAGHPTAFADLSTATNAEQAISIVCSAATISDAPEPAAALIAADPQMVILADNAEQVMGLGSVVATVLARTRRLQLLVTSRTPLNIRAEHVVAMHPLPVDADEGVSDAAALFVLHARRSRPDAPLTASDPAVLGICELTGGIPLAIEIAAGRLGRLDPPALLERLRQRRGLLLDQAGSTDLPDRQHSLRVVLDATISLLDADRLAVARQLSVVRGPVTVELLARMLFERVEPDELIDALDELAGLGLLTTDEAGRCQLHIPVAEYFLDEHPGDAVDRRCVVAAVLWLAEPLVDGIDTHGRWAETRLLDDAAAITTACESVVADREVAAAVRLAGSLRRAWLLSSRLDDALTFCTTMQSFAANPEDRVPLQLVGAQFSAILGRADAGGHLVAALAAADSAAIDGLLVLNSRCYLGSWCCDYGDESGARDAAARVLADAVRSGDPATIELARDFSAYIANRLGDMETASALCAAALADARLRGDRYVVISLLNRQCEIELTLERPDTARALIDEALELGSTMSLGPLGAKMLAQQAAVEVELDNISAAIGACRAALRMTCERYPDPLTQAAVLRIMASAWQAAGDDRTATRADEAAATILRRASAPVDTPTIGPIDRRLESLRADSRLAPVRSRVALELESVIAELLQ